MRWNHPALVRERLVRYTIRHWLVASQAGKQADSVRAAKEQGAGGFHGAAAVPTLRHMQLKHLGNAHWPHLAPQPRLADEEFLHLCGETKLFSHAAQLRHAASRCLQAVVLPADGDPNGLAPTSHVPE